MFGLQWEIVIGNVKNTQREAIKIHPLVNGTLLQTAEISDLQKLVKCKSRK